MGFSAQKRHGTGEDSTWSCHGHIFQSLLADFLIVKLLLKGNSVCPVKLVGNELGLCFTNAGSLEVEAALRYRKFMWKYEMLENN